MTTARGRIRTRGALLLEAMLALAIFVVTALAVLAVVDRATGMAAAVRDRERASQLAQSAMAQIESGIAVPQALVGPVRDAGGESGAGAAGRPWELEVATEPSDVRGLTLVRVTALRRGAAGGRVIASCTLAQLVRLGRTPSAGGGSVDGGER